LHGSWVLAWLAMARAESEREERGVRGEGEDVGRFKSYPNRLQRLNRFKCDLPKSGSSMPPRTDTVLAVRHRETLFLFTRRTDCREIILVFNRENLQVIEG
ncbi:9259_t:CDS:2, partial [Acaulospora colombiana]